MIAANLNLAQGGYFGTISDTVIADSAAGNSLLASGFSGSLPYGIKTSSAAGKQLISEATYLEAYNTAALIPACAAAEG